MHRLQGSMYCRQWHVARSRSRGEQTLRAGSPRLPGQQCSFRFAYTYIHMLSCASHHIDVLPLFALTTDAVVLNFRTACGAQVPAKVLASQMITHFQTRTLVYSSHIVPVGLWRHLSCSDVVTTCSCSRCLAGQRLRRAGHYDTCSSCYCGNARSGSSACTLRRLLRRAHLHT
jgi:hypothetical protein